ncbi:hypothetical protein D3C87_1783020 [compost metagenome]
MGFLIVRAQARTAGHVGLVEQQGLARSTIGVETDEVGGAPHAVAVNPGRQQIANHPLVPGQRIDLIAGFLQQSSGPVDAALVGGVVSERAVDQP